MGRQYLQSTYGLLIVILFMGYWTTFVNEKLRCMKYTDN